MIFLPDRVLSHLKAVAGLPDIFGTRYQIVAEVGRGGMGVVYEAEDPALGRRVALKVLDLPDPNGELSERLLREARILARLEHPGIVPVHEVGTLADGRVFYTMKLVRGDRLDRHLPQVKHLSERLRLFERICEPVAFGHSRGILHRDLKPQNVMVGPFGEVLVIDWGVAKVFSELEPMRVSGPPAASQPLAAPLSEKTTAPGTREGTVMGTPGYMAPEQARGSQDIDQRADVYSLGAVLCFMLGVPYADGHTPRTPPALTAISTKAMSSEPVGRYSTVQDLAADVARFLDGEPVSAYPEGVMIRLARIAAKHRMALILVLAYLLTRVFLFFWLKR
jgi:eukaryotic-like serine/threonine-protein kinase